MGKVVLGEVLIGEVDIEYLMSKMGGDLVGHTEKVQDD
jgi:hypothetical protein